MRGATLTGQTGIMPESISTHTPHAGRDLGYFILIQLTHNFNSHAPCGARPTSSGSIPPACAFQLTRPMRGATRYSAAAHLAASISTHTPHAGRDQPPARRKVVSHEFQLTRPMRGATHLRQAFDFRRKFQLTRPMRGATAFCLDTSALSVFQLTRPMRGATVVWDIRQPRRMISTHTPHAGRD